MNTSISTYLKKIISEKYFPSIITVILLLTSSLAIWSLVKDQHIIIERNSVDVRLTPSTNAQSVAIAKKGDDFVVLTSQNGWLKIRYDSHTDGWVPQWLLDNPQLTSDQNLAAQILVETPIYQLSDENSEVVATISPENYLIVIYEDDGWIQVEYEGDYGFIRTRAVNLLNREDIPTDEDALNGLRFDEDVIERYRDEFEEMVVVRSEGQPILATPSYNSEILYTTSYGQRFKYIDEVPSQEYSDLTFYQVEDSQGQVGYIESYVSALESKSIGHLQSKLKDDLSQAVIMIDPGHGGIDSGAVAIDQSLEKDYTLRTSLLLKEKLEQQGAQVIILRTDDSDVDLVERSDLSNEAEVDVFLSIHYDSIDDVLNGTTTYYYHEYDASLANAVNNALAALPLTNNGARFGDFSILRENTRPALLLELGYLSNQGDLTLIQSETYQNQVTDAIVTGLQNYFSGEN